MTVTYDFETGGFDIGFSMPELSTDQYVEVSCNSIFISHDADETSPSGVVRLTKAATGYTLEVLDTNGLTIDEASIIYPVAAVDVRITVNNNVISILLNGLWVMTFWLSYVKHAESPTVYMRASGAITVTNICLVELSDCRPETIWIDVEETGENVISAVIKRRPVLTWPRYDGVQNYAYNPARSVHTVYRVTSWEEAEKLGSAASDIIFFHENAGVRVDLETLEDFGFLTRALRYSDFDHGAIAAAREAQTTARQRTKQYTFTRPIMPALEFYDVVNLQARSGDALTGVDDFIVVEDIKVALAPNGIMRVRGRKE